MRLSKDGKGRWQLMVSPKPFLIVDEIECKNMVMNGNRW
jgi:hypothetical protein